MLTRKFLLNTILLDSHFIYFFRLFSFIIGGYHVETFKYMINSRLNLYIEREIDNHRTDYTNRHTPTRSDTTGAPSCNNGMCQHAKPSDFPIGKLKAQLIYMYM